MSIVIRIIALSIIFPILFQAILGTISIFKKTKTSFKTVCTYSIASQFIVSIIVFTTLYLDLTKGKEPKCLNPMLGVFGAIVGCFIILIFLILIQAIINHFVKNKNVNKK
jgi:uncharacterized BrkB/YihY/UPF0761 family membrane protein